MRSGRRCGKSLLRREVKRAGLTWVTLKASRRKWIALYRWRREDGKARVSVHGIRSLTLSRMPTGRLKTLCVFLPINTPVMPVCHASRRRLLPKT
ncbi:hypothetical protein Y887_18455 [Xanthomonas pisi DSM 18956]|nr:hypothetical protein Y887_18455 [Xanthomonas pisi DSM 18956]